MIDRLLRYFDLSVYRTRLEQDSARLIYLTTGILLLAWMIYAVTIRQWTIEGVTSSALLIETLPYRADTALYFFLPLILAGITMMLLRRGQVRLAAWGPPFIFYAFAILRVLLSTTEQFDSPVAAVSLGFLLTLFILLNRQTGLLFGLPIVLFTMAIRPGTLVESGNLLVLVFLYTGAATIIYIFVRLAPVSREETASAALAERLKLAEINSRITREASRRAPLQDILNLAISLILENYTQLYHAQVFLLDENETHAVLHASTGETGKQLLARKHSLPVGSLSVIGQVTLRGTPVVEYAGDQASVHRENDLLPQTSVEAAFPLFAGEKIIGALDLQSRFRDAFPDDDLPGFQSMADSLSLVLDNVRQFELARQRIEENRHLAEQARDALHDIEQLNQRLVGQAWSEYLRRQDRAIGLRLEAEQETSEPDLEWSEYMVDALRDNQPVQSGQTIAYPLRLQGQVIGAIEFEMDDEHQIEPEDLALLEEISEQFGLAAENNRLVEVSQKAASRETVINEISSRIQGNTNVEATLTEAARSLFQTLKAHRVSIQLATSETSDAPPGTQTSQLKQNNGRNG